MSSTQAQLQQIESSTAQKDRAQPYLSLLQSILDNGASNSLIVDLITFGHHFTQSTSMTSILGRGVLNAYVVALCAGSGYQPPPSVAEASAGDSQWEQLGTKVFGGENGEDRRVKVVEGVLEGGGGGWCDEQVTVIRRLHSHLLQQEEDWQGAAKALSQIPLENTSRNVPDEEKLDVYIEIVRLFLECQEWGQAQLYFNRAAVLITSDTKKEQLLYYKMCQARMADFSAKFNEAAMRYHELSFDSSVLEEDRLQMLKAAVTNSILAPSGPQRSRTLASLNRDERIHTTLPPYLSVMLKKMLLEYIVRASEVKEFEAGLAEHQKAKVEGGGTVLERAVREHNVGACAKVYDNIAFDALGAILGLSAEGAEITARKMIEQGRLRAWIDQPLHTLYFESRSTHDTDADAQGTAGGLGVEVEEKDVEPVSWTERWDDRIREISNRVEGLATAIQARQGSATATA